MYKTRYNDTNFKVNDISGVVSTLIRFDRESLASDILDLQVIAEDGYPSSIPGQSGPNTGTVWNDLKIPTNQMTIYE